MGSMLTTVRCLSFAMIHDRISKKSCRGRRYGNNVSVIGAFFVYRGEDIGVFGEWGESKCMARAMVNNGLWSEWIGVGKESIWKRVEVRIKGE